MALKLSTFLESEDGPFGGTEVSVAADLYRDEIMKQLAAAVGCDCTVSDTVDGSDFVQSATAVDATAEFRRAGRTYARRVKRDF